MKSGELSKALGLSRDTLFVWLKRPEFQKFFSPEALGQVGATQRQFNESDVLVMNTIRALRHEHGVDAWADIAARLETGERYQEFPSSAAISIDNRTIPLPQAEQSARAAATMAERDNALARVRELENEVERLRGELEASRKEHKSDLERLLREIADLNRLVGRLERDND